ncbi:MAG: carboxylating nicotinate-nucleotide diphosphorylase [Candidatus Omnitrophica bacterium]|nr:carboxylating nicotinate-nucleotide diphosphorylase [Candidatus Omnitrophota bacterium]MDD5574074.1 carboxylating nicotinate-nucleotide diphosphorylase [Candidatus Omnitrophota bacterium]
MRFHKASMKGLIRAALLEDTAHEDITTLDFIPAGVTVKADIVSREKGVVCGLGLAHDVFKMFDRTLGVRMFQKDGVKVDAGRILMSVRGRARSVLSCERLALNFLGYLSGIATQTSEAYEAVRRQGIRILDTRKTTPLMRSLEKYAVCAGGGTNHRLNLSDQYLVKDNHILILRETDGFEALFHRRKKVPFEIEVENLDELRRSLVYRPDIVMLDNFSPHQVRRAVLLLRDMFPDRKHRPLIELSGGITPQNIARYAIRGVDFISLGALTHSARALDVSLEIVKVYR